MPSLRRSLSLVVGLLVAVPAGLIAQQDEGQGPPPKLPAQAEAPPTPPGLGAEGDVPERPRDRRAVRNPTQLMAAMRTGRALPAQAEAPPTPPGLGAEGDVPERPRDRRAVRNPRQLMAAMRTGRALPAQAEAPPAPPGLEPEQDVPDPPADRRPTRQRLIERIQELPGGTEWVEEARQRARRGAPSVRVRRGDGESGPAVHLETGGVPAAGEALQDWSVALTPASPSTTDANMYGVGVLDPYWSDYWRLYASTSWSSLGYSVAGSYLVLRINVPADGWYIVNLYGRFSSADQLVVKRHAGSGSWETLETFNYDGMSSGWYDNPVLLELAAGWHYLYWQATEGIFEVSEVNAFDVEP